MLGVLFKNKKTNARKVLKKRRAKKKKKGQRKFQLKKNGISVFLENKRKNGY